MRHPCQYDDVAQIVNLPYRRLSTGDTADYQSALQNPGLHAPQSVRNRDGVSRVLDLPAEMQVLYLITGQSRKGLAFWI